MNCAASLGTAQFCSSRLERIFNDCFAVRWRTRLQGGADEPYYQPATGSATEHALFYRSDYFASALHEVAHWSIAGKERRLKPDFGYWYTPDCRSPDQQRAFEVVESKPQALEWIFSRACGYRFQPSADNLELASQGLLDSEAFRQSVLKEVRRWQVRGLPQRAGIFYRALCAEFQTTSTPDELQFDPGESGCGPEQE